MKKIITCIILVISVGYTAVSCYTEKMENINHDVVEYIQPQITAYYDSIKASFIGDLLVTKDYVIWENPHSTEDYLHIIDKSERKELASLDCINDELKNSMTTRIEKGIQNELIIHDFDFKRKANILIDNFKTNSNGFTFTDITYGENILKIIKLSDGNDLLFSPEAKQPFGIVKDNIIYSSGKYPITNMWITPDDILNYFDGTIIYNATNEMLLYSTSSFRYMALYKRHGNKLRLIKETGGPDYSIENNRLKLGKNENGISDIALTKNYIITAEHLKEGISSKETLCVYDYNLQLKKILRIDQPIARIGANSDTDTIFAVIESPEYKMVTISF